MRPRPDVWPFRRQDQAELKAIAMSTTKTTLHNVLDRRHSWIGSWDAVPFDYNALTMADVGRTVIYLDRGREMAWGWAEAGTLSSFRDGLVFVRFSKGDTAAACAPHDLMLARRPLDGDLLR